MRRHIMLPNRTMLMPRFSIIATSQNSPYRLYSLIDILGYEIIISILLPPWYDFMSSYQLDNASFFISASNKYYQFANNKCQIFSPICRCRILWKIIVSILIFSFHFDVSSLQMPRAIWWGRVSILHRNSAYIFTRGQLVEQISAGPCWQSCAAIANRENNIALMLKPSFCPPPHAGRHNDRAYFIPLSTTPETCRQSTRETYHHRSDESAKEALEELWSIGAIIMSACVAKP